MADASFDSRSSDTDSQFCEAAFETACSPAGPGIRGVEASLRANMSRLGKLQLSSPPVVEGVLGWLPSRLSR